MTNGSTARKRIFYIEDDEDSAELMRWILTLAGYDVSLSPSPHEALPIVKLGGFDLILLEMRLVGQSGVALCKEIRAFNPDIPIVFFTSSAYSTDREEGLKAGANAYLIKPSGLETIEGTIAQLISR